jgi:hypothetical protein
VRAVLALSRRVTGVLLVLLGAWGGILPYVGPLFGYRMDGTSAWTWTTGHWELNLLPGIAAVLAGLILLTGRRAGAALGGWLAMLSGGWFVLGPLFASMWLPLGESQSRVASSSLSNVVQPLGYHYGTGLVIVLLGAWALGRALFAGPVAAPHRAGYPTEEELGGRHATTAPPAGTATGATTPTAAEAPTGVISGEPASYGP